MLTCKQASQLISQSLDQPLSRLDRFKLRFHLLICDACTRFNRQLRQLRMAMQKLVNIEQDSAIQLTAETKAKIISRIEAEARPD